MPTKNLVRQRAARRRIDTRLVTGAWQPHCYSGPAKAPSELIRGMWIALVPAMIFWSVVVVGSYWLLAVG